MPSRTVAWAPFCLDNPLSIRANRRENMYPLRREDKWDYDRPIEFHL